MSSLKQLIFVSYSHSPPEESEFARQLAHRLRDVGFEPWLDEEQILPGADFEAVIRKTISSASRAVFLVTRRWLERPYTRLELNLFANHANPTCRLVAVKREDIEDLELAPQLQRMNVIPWLPDDSEPDACFWLVYCGLTGKPQGPRENWDEEGRKLCRRPASVPTDPTPAPAAPFGAEPWLPCQARPVLLAPSPHGTLLASDTGECFLIGASGLKASEPLRELQGCTAAVVAPDGTLVASRYSPMVAVLGPKGWEFQTCTSEPVLSLAATPHGVTAGDRAGNAILFLGGGRYKTVRFGEPMLDLQPSDAGLAALGAQGALGFLGWADEWDEAFQMVSLARYGNRPVGLFDAGKPGRIGYSDGDRLAVVDVGTGRVSPGARHFPEGIRQVVLLKRRPVCYGVLTDAGELVLVEADLSAARMITLPGNGPKVAGVCRGPGGGVLAWTVEGNLYALSRDNAIRKVAEENIVLAHAESDASGRIHVVRWRTGGEAQVRQIQVESSR
jgi:hypothetical protein